MERKNLVKAAKEFNKVVILDEHPVKDLKSKDLEKNLFDALRFIEEDDKFTKATDAIFNELKIKFTPKPKELKPKSKVKKAKAVEVGTTVELDVATDKIKNGKSMKKNEKGASAQMMAARLLLSKTAKKDEMLNLLENGEIFTKKVKKILLKVTNFLSLKKQMTDHLDPDVVAEVKKEIAAAKPASKPKVKKDSILVAGIKTAIKVKQLKKIAKVHEQFDWKSLKKLDFDEMQKAMVTNATSKAKPKMINNPLIAEIDGFKKAKKLVKWAKAQEEIGFQKSMKKMDLADLQEALIKSLPAKIEAESDGKRSAVVNHIDQEARRERVTGLINEAKYTRKELMAILLEEFPEKGKAHTNSNILSECKNPNRWEKFGNFGGLVETDANGFYMFASTKKKKSGKKGKDKKNKK